MEKKYNNIYINKIQPLFDFINNKLNTIGKQIFKYNSTVNFKDLFYIILCANKDKFSSYSKALNDAFVDDIIKVSKTAIIKKRQKCHLPPYSYFEQLNKDVIEFIYSDVTYRLLATDGTIFYVEIKLANENIPKSNNDNCCKIKLNAIFDVERNIPINYGLCDKNDERSLLKNQFSALKKNDIVVHDGGYYSEHMYNMYIINNVNAIFRINKTKARGVVTSVISYII